MPHSSRRVTLKDVGDHVGVSAKTVSNVVNGTGWVSDAVRLRIQEAIEELGYRPNAAARHLRSGNSGIVSLALPNLREPYFAGLASSFVTEARRRNLTVLVTQTDGDPKREVAAIQGRDLPVLDGIICSPLSARAHDLGDHVPPVPVVLIGEYGEHLKVPTFSHVGIDNIAASRAATAHLIAQGCRHLAVVGYQEDQSQATSRLRFEGYRRALDEAGLIFDPALVGAVSSFNLGEASQAVHSLVRSGRPFDGIVCFSDTMALGALHALASEKLKVPEQIKLIGFDNIEEGRFSIPAFDTVDPRVELMASSALDIIQARPRSGTRVRIPFEVLSRSTTS
ncbi:MULTISPECIES: LacI family DNA-binding transcriptional regulator [Schaalia]|uniref:LacI family DNA-binding transcriptional regulator n=1 Tax=Schaalia TaxID=2529408 RepID=UPI0023F85E8A|nr:LacI family DNA-binding transcriptional regulator [Schaalia hyovaginalis]MCI7672209.1 LacI family transcriptional regulator [Schaalia hyovaginalis]MDY5505987.1 LacI family DNA-binding transcriptional regulator [Schaalia hyovaginalis]